MNYRYLLILLLGLSLLLFSCAGEDENEEDTVPPVAPVLVPHLGDTGDPPVLYEGQTVFINDDNNGIDTVPDGDWIRVSWDPFKDTDLSHVLVYRYDVFEEEPVKIDSISASNQYFLDTDSDLTERVWYSYFIDLVDTSGNTTRSDTVSYALLSKSILLEPADSETISPLGAEFKWNRSGSASRFRLILFDENYNYVWHQDIVVSTEPDPLEVLVPVNVLNEHSGQTLRWRVDSFDWDETTLADMGSESFERTVHIQ